MSVSALTGTDFSLNLLNTADDTGNTPDFAADFESIDDNATGVITQNEFERAFSLLPWPDALKASGADAIFAQLDPAGTGRVQYDDFVAGMTALAAKVVSATTSTPVPASYSTDAAASSSGLTGLSALFAPLAQASAPDQTDQAMAAPVSDPSDADETALTETFETAYAAIDTSGIGYITAPQLAQAFGSLPLPASVAALGPAGILAKLDPNFTGQISHSTFVAGLAGLATGSSAVAPAASSAVAATPSQDNGSESSSSTDEADLAALTQYFDSVFTSIAPDDDSDTISEIDLDEKYEQLRLQLPASLRSLTASELFARLDPYSTGAVTRSNFVRDMTDLVTAAKDQEARASAAAAAGATTPPSAQQLSAMFSTIDVLGSGSVTLREFEQTFDSLSLDPTIAGLGADVIFSMLDPNATGRVSEDTFVNGLNSIADAQNYFRTAAASIDSDGDGVITREDFEQAFDSLQLPAAARDVGEATVYGRIDPYYMGQVSIADFVNGMTALVAQSVTPTDAAAATTNVTNGDLILNGFYQGSATS